MQPRRRRRRRRQAKRVWPRVTKLYREKIYFPVTATTYPDAFCAFTTADPPHSISNRPRDGGSLPLKKICRAFSFCIEPSFVDDMDVDDVEIFPPPSIFFCYFNAIINDRSTFFSSVSEKNEKDKSSSLRRTFQ